jgi:hypothetical protein
MMNLKIKISLLIIGTVLSMAGLNLLLGSDSAKNTGAVIALSGVFIDIIAVVLIMAQEKWLDEI